MHKKYFFFDIDGTLTDDATHLIVPSAERTLHALEKKGHFVAIATGRMHYKAVSFTDSIDIHNVVCAGGGCLVVNDQIIEMKPLDHAMAMDLLAHCENEGRGWLATLKDSDEVWMKDYRFLEQAGRRTELTTYHYDPDLDLSHTAIYKLYIACTKEEEEARSWLKDSGHLRMGNSYVVIQYDAKKEGILSMMKHIGGPLEDVVVFGNEVNDLVMFDPAWTSIAMGNGSPFLQAKADYVTAANTDDGIEKACRHFGWID